MSLASRQVKDCKEYIDLLKSMADENEKLGLKDYAKYIRNQILIWHGHLAYWEKTLADEACQQPPHNIEKGRTSSNIKEIKNFARVDEHTLEAFGIFGLINEVSDDGFAAWKKVARIEMAHHLMQVGRKRKLEEGNATN